MYLCLYTHTTIRTHIVPEEILLAAVRRLWCGNGDTHCDGKEIEYFVPFSDRFEFEWHVFLSAVERSEKGKAGWANTKDDRSSFGTNFFFWAIPNINDIYYSHNAIIQRSSTIDMSHLHSHFTYLKSDLSDTRQRAQHTRRNHFIIRLCWKMRRTCNFSLVYLQRRMMICQDLYSCKCIILHSGKTYILLSSTHECDDTIRALCDYMQCAR